MALYGVYRGFLEDQVDLVSIRINTISYPYYYPTYSPDPPSMVHNDFEKSSRHSQKDLARFRDMFQIPKPYTHKGMVGGVHPYNPYRIREWAFPKSSEGPHNKDE